MRVAIVGGGPGGLFTAYYLQKFLPGLLQVTIFEASSRLGGKVCTRSFGNTSALYEAGVAELYNYDMHEEDPLRSLVDSFGLDTVPMSGSCVILGDAILNTMADVQRIFGAGTAKAVEDFYQKCRSLCSPQDYYSDDWEKDNGHAWSRRTLRDR
jgi:monoamine oxidase